VSTLELLLAQPSCEVVPARSNTYFRIGGVEIASAGGQVAGITIGGQVAGDAFVNGLKPSAYARCGAYWKRAWIRAAKTSEQKTALRSFFGAFENIHGIKAGNQR
jgi:hypothetical protein